MIDNDIMRKFLWEQIRITLKIVVKFLGPIPPEHSHNIYSILNEQKVSKMSILGVYLYECLNKKSYDELERMMLEIDEKEKERIEFEKFLRESEAEVKKYAS